MTPKRFFWVLACLPLAPASFAQETTAPDVNEQAVQIPVSKAVETAKLEDARSEVDKIVSILSKEAGAFLEEQRSQKPGLAPAGAQTRRDDYIKLLEGYLQLQKTGGEKSASLECAEAADPPDPKLHPALFKPEAKLKKFIRSHDLPEESSWVELERHLCLRLKSGEGALSALSQAAESDVVEPPAETAAPEDGPVPESALNDPPGYQRAPDDAPAPPAAAEPPPGNWSDLKPGQRCYDNPRELIDQALAAGYDEEAAVYSCNLQALIGLANPPKPGDQSKGDRGINLK